MSESYFERALKLFGLDAAFNLSMVKRDIRNATIQLISPEDLLKFDSTLFYQELNHGNLLISKYDFDRYIEPETGNVIMESLPVNSDVNLGKILGFIDPVDLSEVRTGTFALDYTVSYNGNEAVFYTELVDVTTSWFRKRFYNQLSLFTGFGVLLDCKVTHSFEEFYHEIIIREKILSRDIDFWNRHPYVILNHVVNILGLDYVPDLEFNDSLVDLIVLIQTVYDKYDFEAFDQFDPRLMEILLNRRDYKGFVEMLERG